MIKSFKSRETEKIFRGRFSKKLPQMEVAQEALGDRLEREVHPLTKAA